MIIAALVLAALAALLHVYIFVMESLTWTSPATRKVFGTSVEEAAATREMAFNQGFYNLFLALITFVGVGVYAAGHGAVGTALVVAGVGSMTAAALVLLLSSPAHRGAAIKQGALPALALLTVLLSTAL